MAEQEKLRDMLYEVEWIAQESAADMSASDLLTNPAANKSSVGQSTAYMSKYWGMTANVIMPVQPDTYMSKYKIGERASYVDDLELLARTYALVALERLGWQRVLGEKVMAEDLQQQLGVVADYRFLLLRRLLVMLAEAGVLTPQAGGGYHVAAGVDTYHHDPEALARQLEVEHGQDAIELALLRRCGRALADVLCGQLEPLTLLFPEQGLGASDLYTNSPAIQASHTIIRDTIALMVKDLPEEQQVRVLEIGAGKGSATAWILSALPAGCFRYTFADISAGFFPETKTRFSADEDIDYRVLDITKEPVEQGFAAHDYDLIVAPSVLHTAKDLHASLTHCRKLLAPEGHLLTVERVRNRGWADLTFGLLDGWWQFDDDQHTENVPASSPAPRSAFKDASLEEFELPQDGSALELVVINAQAPKEETTLAGCWVLVADRGGVAVELAAELAQRNYKVVLLGDTEDAEGNVISMSIDIESRTAWHSLLKELPAEVPLLGVVHLVALDGHGVQASAKEMGHTTKRIVVSALALIQGLLDAGLAPAQGSSFITRGAQVLEQERRGELAGATLWGLGKTITSEAPHLQPRLIDLDPRDTGLPSYLVAELLFPDNENHIAYRAGNRKVARLVRLGASKSRLALPQNSNWRLMSDPHGTLAGLRVEPVPDYKLGADEVRIAVDAASINFKDVKISLGLDRAGDPIGCDACGRVLEVGTEVTEVAVGDRVVTLGRIPQGKFASETISRQDLVVSVSTDMPTEALAATPLCFTTAAFSLHSAGLKAGERVLIHAATGGVGQAATQLAHALGAEVYATTSTPKQTYLRSLGVSHVFDSRQTQFGKEILAATGGKGVQVVLNSLAGEGFIEASLSCLDKGGRFVEIGGRGIWSKAEMAKVRPDIAYTIILLADKMRRRETERIRMHFKDVMQRLCRGELKPPDYSLWPFTEARTAIEFVRMGQHIGKSVLTMPPLRNGKLREDRTYLVTGGLGGIGLAVAKWLVDSGATAIVLNGHKPPDAAVNDKLDALRQRGVKVQVELSNVADNEAVEAMLANIETSLPPLAGVIHSTGALPDAALTHQSWEKFEQVLWPKIVGAWHLHQATKNLDMFVVFTSVAGIIGTSEQAHHAAADAFLDQLVAHRRALGLPGMSIAWGAWSSLGEADEHHEQLAEQREARGSSWLTPQQEINPFAYLLQQNLTSVLVWPVDWQGFASSCDNKQPLVEKLLLT